jgi:isochorismate hydrolase
VGIPTISPYRMPEAAELPVNQARWRLEPGRAALLVHDMQQYFVDFFPAGREPVGTLVANITAIRRAAAQAGIPVFYTAQPGGMTPAERGLLHDMWGPGMNADPDARQIVPELGPQEGDVVLTKWRYSAFARSDFEERLHRAGRDQLILCGIYAHVGVLMTAIDAFTRDIQPFLVGDAIADFTAEYHRLAVDYAAQRCAMAVPTSAVLNALGDIR